MDSKLLMPIAMLQGLWLLQRTPRLPVPSGRAGRIGSRPGAPLRVVGLGDSIMAGTGVREQCHSLTACYAQLLQDRMHRDVEWQVHGHNGATSAAVLHTVAPSVPSAHVYLLSVGVNDVTWGVEPVRFARNLESLVRLLRDKSPRAAILFGGLPPLECVPALPWPLRPIMAQRAYVVFRFPAGHARGAVCQRRLPPGRGCLRTLGRRAARTLAAGGLDRFQPDVASCSR